MKISKHDQKLILVLLGLVVFLAAYFGICKTFNNKKADIETQISELEAQSEKLRAYAADQASYQDEINKIGDSIGKEMAKYPGDVRSEDMIMYATELENKLGISIDSISIASPEVVSKFSVPEKSGNAYELVPVVAVKTGLTISCSMSYEQFKSLLNYIYSSADKTDIADVTVNYDQQTGGLIGTVTIDKYFIASADYKYSPTDIPSVRKGTEDPFGTLETPASPSPSPSPSPSGTT